MCIGLIDAVILLMLIGLIFYNYSLIYYKGMFRFQPMKTPMVDSIPRPGADPSSPEFQVNFVLTVSNAILLEKVPWIEDCIYQSADFRAWG
jgi:hypothetical protein